MKAHIKESDYWDKYYKNELIERPSPFAIFCQEHYLTSPVRLIEFGSGSGRDLCFFDKMGHSVTGFDTSAAAANAVRTSNENIDYQVGDFTNLDKMENIQAVYSRWTIHSITIEDEARALSWASENLEPGGLLLIEVRTINDHLFGKGEKVGHNTFITDHSRRFIVAEELIATITNLGFELVYQIESNGLSVYKGDDPVLLRVVGRKLPVNS